MSLFLQAALVYAETGFKVFPCKPGSKAPATEHGFYDATTDPDQIQAWWKENPAYNIAIATEGLLVVDVDKPDSRWIETVFPGPPDCPICGTPGGGSHLYFIEPEGKHWTNTVRKLADGIDTRAHGGYVIVPPSSLANGTYIWVPGYMLGERLDLEPPPEALQQELDRFQRGHYPEHDDWRRCEPILEGSRDNTLTQIGGLLRHYGFSVGEILATIGQVNTERCKPRLDAISLGRIAHSVAKYEPNHFAAAAVQEPEEVPEEEAPDPGAFPLDLVENVPGFMQKVIQYTLRTSPRPQPVFALAGAISLMSVLCGRKIRTETDLRPNLLNLVIGKSGSGKDRARQVNRDILLGIGLDELLGSEEIQSGNGIYTTVRTTPCVLLQLDEIGAMLQRIRQSRSDALSNVPAVMVRVYNSAAGLCKLGGYADATRNFSVNQPHLVLLGTTVLESFAASLTTEQLTDGFMSRIIVFHSQAYPPKQSFGIEPVPVEILHEAALWGDYWKNSGNLISENPIAKILKEESKDASEQFELYTDKYTRQNVPLWNRSVEKAQKLALVYAASEHGPGVSEISEAATRWGCRLSEYTTRETLWIASEHVADSKTEEEIQRFLRWLKRRPGQQAKWHEYARRFKHLLPRAREDLIKTCREAGFVKIEDSQAAKGRPGKVIVFRKEKVIH